MHSQAGSIDQAFPHRKRRENPNLSKIKAPQTNDSTKSIEASTQLRNRSATTKYHQTTLDTFAQNQSDTITPKPPLETEQSHISAYDDHKVKHTRSVSLKQARLSHKHLSPSVRYSPIQKSQPDLFAQSGLTVEGEDSDDSDIEAIPIPRVKRLHGNWNKTKLSSTASSLNETNASMDRTSHVSSTTTVNTPTKDTNASMNRASHISSTSTMNTPTKDTNVPNTPKSAQIHITKPPEQKLLRRQEVAQRRRSMHVVYNLDNTKTLRVHPSSSSSEPNTMYSASPQSSDQSFISSQSSDQSSYVSSSVSIFNHISGIGPTIVRSGLSITTGGGDNNESNEATMQMLADLSHSFAPSPISRASIGTSSISDTSTITYSVSSTAERKSSSHAYTSCASIDKNVLSPSSSQAYTSSMDNDVSSSSSSSQAYTSYTSIDKNARSSLHAHVPTSVDNDIASSPSRINADGIERMQESAASQSQIHVPTPFIQRQHRYALRGQTALVHIIGANQSPDDQNSLAGTISDSASPQEDLRVSLTESSQTDSTKHEISMNVDSTKHEASMHGQIDDYDEKNKLKQERNDDPVTNMHSPASKLPSYQSSQHDQNETVFESMQRAINAPPSTKRQHGSRGAQLLNAARKQDPLTISPVRTQSIHGTRASTVSGVRRSLLRTPNSTLASTLATTLASTPTRDVLTNLTPVHTTNVSNTTSSAHVVEDNSEHSINHKFTQAMSNATRNAHRLLYETQNANTSNSRTPTFHNLDTFTDKTTTSFVPLVSLPEIFTKVLEHAMALDQCLIVHRARVPMATWSYVKSSVELMTRRSFTLTHLQHILAVANDMYTVTPRMATAKGQFSTSAGRSDRSTWRHVIEISPSNEATVSGIVRRKQLLKQKVRAYVALEYSRHLSTVLGTHMAFCREKNNGTTWLPMGCLSGEFPSLTYVSDLLEQILCETLSCKNNTTTVYAESTNGSEMTQTEINTTEDQRSVQSSPFRSNISIHSETSTNPTKISSETIELINLCFPAGPWHTSFHPTLPRVQLPKLPSEKIITASDVLLSTGMRQNIRPTLLQSLESVAQREKGQSCMESINGFETTNVSMQPQNKLNYAAQEKTKNVENNKKDGVETIDEQQQQQQQNPLLYTPPRNTERSNYSSSQSSLSAQRSPDRTDHINLFLSHGGIYEDDHNNNNTDVHDTPATMETAHISSVSPVATPRTDTMTPPRRLPNVRRSLYNSTTNNLHPKASTVSPGKINEKSPHRSPIRTVRIRQLEPDETTNIHENRDDPTSEVPMLELEEGIATASSHSVTEAPHSNDPRIPHRARRKLVFSSTQDTSNRSNVEINPTPDKNVTINKLLDTKQQTETTNHNEIPKELQGLPPALVAKVLAKQKAREKENSVEALRARREKQQSNEYPRLFAAVQAHFLKSDRTGVRLSTIVQGIQYSGNIHKSASQLHSMIRTLLRVAPDWCTTIRASDGDLLLKVDPTVDPQLISRRLAEGKF